MKRNKRIPVRCSDDEYLAIKKLADEMSFSLSQLLRYLVSEEIKRKGLTHD